MPCVGLQDVNMLLEEDDDDDDEMTLGSQEGIFRETVLIRMDDDKLTSIESWIAGQ